jgi:hypothetical protein
MVEMARNLASGVPLIAVSYWEMLVVMNQEQDTRVVRCDAGVKRILL